MISTLVNVVIAGGLSVLAYYVNNLWTFLILGWLVLLLVGVTTISLLLNGVKFLIKRQWLLASLNLIMLIPLIYFSIPMFTLIGV